MCKAIIILRSECISVDYPYNKAAHSGFETQRRRHQKSEAGVSVDPKMGMCPPRILNEIKKIIQ